MAYRGINLIRRDINLKQNIKTEKDWYILFNILIICIIISVTVVSHLFKSNLETNINQKKSNLSNLINTSLNTKQKEVLRSKINILNDKYTIYKDFVAQNIDITKIHSELLRIYPDLKISKIVSDPNSGNVQFDVKILANGYDNLPKFIETLKDDKIFHESIIRNISFSAKTNLPSQESPSTTPNPIIKKELSEYLDNKQDLVANISFVISRKVLLDNLYQQINRNNG